MDNKELGEDLAQSMDAEAAKAKKNDESLSQAMRNHATTPLPQSTEATSEAFGKGINESMNIEAKRLQDRDKSLAKAMGEANRTRTNPTPLPKK